MSINDSQTYTDKVIALASARHVRTPQGQKKYGEPVGAVIVKNMSHKSRIIQHHGIVSQDAAKKYVGLISEARAAAQKDNHPKVYSSLLRAAKILEKHNGDKQATDYIQFLLRKFFPNLPSPARHVVHTAKIKKT